MSTDLLRPAWSQIDSQEIRLLLGERIGGPGQTDRQRTGPNCIHLPKARADCRVTLTYQDGRIARIEPGQAFDQAQWDAIADDVERIVKGEPVKVGRDYSFSRYPVQGSWRGARSGVQILPPPAGAPTAPMEHARHPFTLEFPLRENALWKISNHRRMREHRELTLLLNVLLAGWTSLQSRHVAHAWGVVQDDGRQPESRWVQCSYLGPLTEAVVDALSPEAPNRLPEIAADRYFDEVRGLDGLGLRVPDDLDDSICRYRALPPDRRDEFNRAAFWLEMASRQWTVSTSASFAALVSTVESLINRRGPGSTKRFRDFLEKSPVVVTVDADLNS